MPTYQKCPKSVRDAVQSVIQRHAFHKPLADASVVIDLVFACGDTDDNGKAVSPAIMYHGQPALGLSRIVNLKDRAKGCGDAEILFDYDWWKDACDERREALIDHELTHLSIVQSRQGAVKTDDLGRPKMRLRKHDVEIGWFVRVANDNPTFSLERYEAQKIMDNFGQYFWPTIVEHAKA